MALLPEQAAIETGVVNAILNPTFNLGYQAFEVGRSHNGQPPPSMGKRYVAVWSDGHRESRSRNCLEEVFYCNVTITIRFTLPFDRWIEHYDDCEAQHKTIRALLHGDIYNFNLTATINALAGFGFNGILPIGFTEALWWQGLDARGDAGPDWFWASPDSPGPDDGLSWRARYGGLKRVQPFPNQK